MEISKFVAKVKGANYVAFKGFQVCGGVSKNILFYQDDAMFNYRYSSQHNFGSGKLLEKLVPCFFNVKVIPVMEKYSVKRVMKGFSEDVGEFPDPQKDFGNRILLSGLTLFIAMSVTTLCGHLAPEFLRVPSKSTA